MGQKVSLVRCTTYDHDDVKTALRESIRNLGGLAQYVAPGEKVLLKLNLLAKRQPEEGVTTHPAFVRALTELLQEHGCTVVLGDSPGGPFTKRALEATYEAAGIAEVARKTGATLNYNVGSVERKNPQGKLLKSLSMTAMLEDVDHVICVSKLKTHKMMTFTGAVKNMFGTIPGIAKAEFHLNMKDYDLFASALVDICRCANPVLSFMDGIVAMEGEGPSAGHTRPMDAVLASPSPYHLDRVAIALIGLDTDRVPVMSDCIARDLCPEDLAEIELVGEPIERLAALDFVIPETAMVVPKAATGNLMKRFLGRFVQPRPMFDRDTCVGCGICVANCPSKALALKDKVPELTVSKCIRCYCCQELCPERAVTVHRPALLRALVK